MRKRTRTQPKMAKTSAPTPALLSLAEQLAMATKTTPPDARVVEQLWAAVLQASDKQREDTALLKLVPPARLLAMMKEEHAALAYAAAGCLARLAQHPPWTAELTATAAATNRLVAVCIDLLNGPHNRSRLPAVQLLLVLSRQPLQVPRVATALQALLSLLADAGGPGWASGKCLARGCCGVLAALLAPSECEAAEQQQARRLHCLAAGAVHSLVVLLAQGSSGAALLPAAACLRFLALAPGAADAMAGDPSVSAGLLQLLSAVGPGSHAGVAAYVGGIIWELSAAAAAAQQLLQAGAVPLLLDVVLHTSTGTPGSSSSSSKKKKRAAGSKTTGKAKGAPSAAAPAAAPAATKRGGSRSGAAAASTLPPPFVLLDDPVAAAQVALCNATGALHHLTFLDEAKAQVGCSGRLPLLVRLLGASKGGQVYDNLVGLLWNVGLLDCNQPLLVAVGAPPHLARPIPRKVGDARDPLSSRPSSRHEGGVSLTSAA